MVLSYVDRALRLTNETKSVSVRLQTESVYEGHDFLDPVRGCHARKPGYSPGGRRMTGMHVSTMASVCELLFVSYSNKVDSSLSSHGVDELTHGVLL